MAQPQQQLQVALEFLKTSYRFDTFREPRGVMRVFHLIFSIWGFFACRDFAVTLKMSCKEPAFTKNHVIDYPFEFADHICPLKVNNQTYLYTNVDASTSAQFFVATAVLSFLYAVFIIFVYAYLDEIYKSKPEFPMADFALTGALGFFWLVGTVAFNSGGSALKKTFDEDYIYSQCSNCEKPHTSSFMDLNIALMIGFLNFFLWVSDLWFLYKETIWFQQRNQILNQQMYGQQQPQQFAGQPQYEQSQYEVQQPQQQQQFGYVDQNQPQQQQQQYGYAEPAHGQQSYGQPPI